MNTNTMQRAARLARLAKALRYAAAALLKDIQDVSKPNAARLNHSNQPENDRPKDTARTVGRRRRIVVD